MSAVLIELTFPRIATTVIGRNGVGSAKNLRRATNRLQSSSTRRRPQCKKYQVDNQHVSISTMELNCYSNNARTTFYSWKSSFQKRHQHNGPETKIKQPSTKNEDEQETKKDDSSSYLSHATSRQLLAFYTQAQSIPNIITISRILSTPILCQLIINHQYNYAITGCVLAGFSDWLDGYVARKYNQKTNLGTYLDPLADKIFINAIAVSMGYAGIIPLFCTGIWMGRDILLVGMAYHLAQKASEGGGHNIVDPSATPLKISPSTSSKVNTCLQFGTIWMGLAMATGLDSGVLGEVVSVGMIDVTPMDALCYSTCGTTVFSGLGYMNGKAMKSRNTEK